jgi:DNA-binding CsgD family transcriptional regulator
MCMKHGTMLPHSGDEMRLPKAQIFTDHEWIELTNNLRMSTRQAQIALCLLSGLGDKQIASQLGISVHTVRTYLDRMFTKMDVRDRNEMVVSIFREFRIGCLGSSCYRRQSGPGLKSTDTYDGGSDSRQRRKCGRKPSSSFAS